MDDKAETVMIGSATTKVTMWDLSQFLSVYSVPLGIIKKGLLLKDNTLRKYIKRKSAAGHESECRIPHSSCSNPERLSHFDDGEDDNDYSGGNDDYW